MIRLSKAHRTRVQIQGTALRTRASLKSVIQAKPNHAYTDRNSVGVTLIQLEQVTKVELTILAKSKCLSQVWRYNRIDWVETGWIMMQGPRERDD